MLGLFVAKQIALGSEVRTMAVSKWAYEPWKCDGEFCIGDCDLCYKAELTKDEIEEIEEDGFITPARYLKNDN